MFSTLIFKDLSEVHIFDLRVNATDYVLWTALEKRDQSVSIVTGGDDGIVRVHKKCENVDGSHEIIFEKDCVKYETKSGLIQSMMVRDVTRFSSEDVLVGDSRGVLTIIMNGQILNRRTIAAGAISDVVTDTDSAGNLSILAGSSDGFLVALSPYEILWRCRLSETMKQEEQTMDGTIGVTALHVFRIHSQLVDANYLIVADTEKRVHLFQGGTLVLSLTLPSVVTSMSTGRFICTDGDYAKSDKSRTPPKAPRFASEDQVALATTSGAVLILSNFSIHPYANLPFPLRQLRTLPASGSDDVDAVICCGHFNQLSVIQNRVLVGEYQTHDWIHTFDVLISPGNSRDGMLIVVGCLDRTIQILEVSKQQSV